MPKLETVALIVASLAAVSALLNALIGLFQAWLDNRRLTISVEPDPWGRVRPDLTAIRGACVVVLRILNRARTPNSVAQIRCRVDSKDLEFKLDPPDFLTRVIAPFSMGEAALMLRADRLSPDSQTVAVTVVPVRGKARMFTFVKTDLLPPF